MTTPIIPCVRCRNWNEGTFTCRAFPDGIPDQVLTGKNFHREPIDGDNGIRFEAAVGLEDDGSHRGTTPQYFDEMTGEEI
jgi:hypothetical protein